jgi:prepilin-type N-terminal cleavage/methylation domain-containing protein
MKQKGFTLIEMLISTSIFIVVMLIAVGSLMSVIDANRKSRTLQLAFDNVHASIEYVSRQIRDGKDYACNASGTLSCETSNTFYYKSASGKDVSYQLVGGAITRTIDGEGTVPITSSAVRIERLNFQLIGEVDDDEQPKVIITVKGKVAEGTDFATDFNVQTTISKRLAFGITDVGDPSTLMNCPYMPAPGRIIVDFVQQR